MTAAERDALQAQIDAMQTELADLRLAYAEIRFNLLQEMCGREILRRQKRRLVDRVRSYERRLA